MRRIDFDEIWNRSIDWLQSVGRLSLVPIWILLETIELVWGKLYDKMTGAGRHEVDDLVADEEAMTAQLLEGTAPEPVTDMESVRSFFNVSLFQPTRFLSDIAGTIPTWFVSREWAATILWAIPTGLVILVSALSLMASRFDRSKLALHYIELGLQELPDGEAVLAIPSHLSSQLNSSQESAAENSASDLVTDKSKVHLSQEAQNISAYAEMLFRRAQLLQPRNQNVLVIGTALIQSGSVSRGRRILRTISPDDKKGFEKGHAVLAASYLREYLETKDQKLMEMFAHHANISVRTPSTPVEVLLFASDLHWQAGRQDAAIEMLELAARRSPTAGLRLAARASQMGDQQLVATARKAALANLLQRLQEEPRNVALRTEAARLLGENSSDLVQAERLLLQGLRLGTSHALSHALSEVYRVRFVRQMVDSKAENVDLALLDKSMKADPTNPLVAEVMVDLVTKAYKASPQFQAALYNVLASGEATLATHAMLAELHLFLKGEQDARIHLERVHSTAPTAIKYAWLLTSMHAKEKRWEEAEQVASTTLQMLESEDLVKERFGCDLLELLARIYEATGRKMKAIDSLSRLLKIEPNRISARKRLVDLYRAVGQEQQAQEQEQAIESR